MFFCLNPGPGPFDKDMNIWCWNRGTQINHVVMKHGYVSSMIACLKVYGHITSFPNEVLRFPHCHRFGIRCTVLQREGTVHSHWHGIHSHLHTNQQNCARVNSHVSWLGTCEKTRPQIRTVRLNGILVDSYHDFKQIDGQLFQFKVFM